jgi:hypothetical protein
LTPAPRDVDGCVTRRPQIAPIGVAVATKRETPAFLAGVYGPDGGEGGTPTRTARWGGGHAHPPGTSLFNGATPMQFLPSSLRALRPRAAGMSQSIFSGAARIPKQRGAHA